MQIEIMKSKIHRATITQADPAYVGSLTLDQDLMEAASLHKGEKVEVVVLENAARWTTYVMPGPRGTGVVGINGPTARMALPGDLVIIFTFGTMTEAEADKFEPAVVFVDRQNQIVRRGTDAAEAVPGTNTLRGDQVYA
ncbi:MAG TPA: aspartate 1-decarboxylase [Pseudonocardiaceae bacterium]|jgi:aspartate 1-decarboxylase|nr:aspartate 1-decarboxylase [Pseudonocardiaceae bacterium]